MLTVVLLTAPSSSPPPPLRRPRHADERQQVRRVVRPRPAVRGAWKRSRGRTIDVPCRLALTTSCTRRLHSSFSPSPPPTADQDRRRPGHQGLGRGCAAAVAWPEGQADLHARLRLWRARLPARHPGQLDAPVRGRAAQDQRQGRLIVARCRELVSRTMETLSKKDVDVEGPSLQ